MTWQSVIEVLEERLARLAAQGVQHLTLPATQPNWARAAVRDAAAASTADLAAPGALRQGAAPPPLPIEPETPELPWTRRLARRAEARAEPPEPEPGPGAAPAREPLAEGAGKHPSELDTIEELSFHFRDCQRCGLSAGRTKLVFGVGHKRPKLMFIGEGPGQEEDRQGLPFVGRAGQLLTAGIEALGLTRDDVYIANVVKCRPPENRAPAPDEIAACAPILQRQIELLDPALIVVLGNVPLKALNPTARGITAERGRIFEHRGWRVLPTFHPAYLLRNPDAIESWWVDLKQAFRLAYGEAP